MREINKKREKILSRIIFSIIIFLTVLLSITLVIQAQNSVSADENQFNFGFSGETELFTVPKSGLYTLETWGAQGGNRVESLPGGKGGYTTGEVYLEKGDQLYINVGGFGDSISKGFNGGGKSGHTGTATYGGGATDIRVGGSGIYNRIIVAAGGGASSMSNPGGSAGGVNGSDGGGSASYNGKGASQTGSIGYNTGGFGNGGNGSQRSSYNNGGGAGGGGWYGGGAAYEYGNYAGAGGGGSSYALTATSYKPTNYNPDNKYYLAKVAIIAGDESFFSPEGIRTVGHEGDGYVRITLSDETTSSTAMLNDIRINGVSIENFKSDNFEYNIPISATTSETKELTVVKKHTNQKVDGVGSVTLTYGDLTHLIRVYSEDGATKNDYIINFIREDNTKLYSLDFNGYKYVDEKIFSPLDTEYELNVFQYTELIPNVIAYDADVTISYQGLDSLKKGENTVKVIVSKRDVETTTYTIKVNVSYALDFSYEGRQQEFVVPHTGYYKLDVWGAQGGSRNDENAGGLGGFSSGVTYLEKGETVYIYVGGNGTTNAGFNGGGKSGHTGTATYGGGATDIRVGGNGLFNRIIVAGGGGASSTSQKGGLAGGAQGFDGGGTATYNGKGASQTGSSGYHTGGFGIGGNGSRRSSYNNGGGAGGGGWYGGGGAYEYSNYYVAGGGGSGYILTNTSYKPTGYNPDSKYYMTNVSDGSIGSKDLNTWEQSFIDVDGKRVNGHAGDGHVRITYLSEAFNASADLQNIYIDGEAIDNFDPETQSYTIEIDGEYVGVKEIVVQKSLENQVVVGVGDINLDSGNYRHDIVVISKDKTTSKTYTLNFVRKNTVKLKELQVEGFLFKNGVPFDPDVFEYEVDVFLDDAIELKYTAFNESTQVLVEGLNNLVEGKNLVKITASNSGESAVYTIIINRKSTLDYTFTGEQQIFVAPYSGYYKLDVWGAQGGSRNDETAGGLGGFSSGVTYLEKGETVYIYVGGNGTTNAGFNGGGKSGHTGTATYGGGATDIRVGGNGLFNRIIVAGGGGASSINQSGGLAGGAQGFDGGGTATYNGKGASQTGSSGYHAGGFGIGGNGSQRSTSYNNGGGAGGGGWYGGGGAYEYSNYYVAGGGGSGYILTNTSYKPTGYNPDSKYYMTNVSDGSIGSKDLNTWEQSFIDVDGKRVNGHAGDGHVRITYYSDSTLKSTEVNYIEINGEKISDFHASKRKYTIEIDAEFEGDLEFVLNKRHIDQEVVGDHKITLTHHNVTHTFTIISADKSKSDTYTIHFVRKPSTKLASLSIDEYVYSFTENFKYNKYSYDLAAYVYGGVQVNYKTFDQNATVTVVGANDSELRPGNNKIMVTVSRAGLQDTVYEINAYRQRDIEFGYTGTIEKFKVPYTGIYQVELWGAQGGSRNETVPGGYGGYVSGEIYLVKDEIIYVTVGGNGDTNAGYNGGGKSGHTGVATYGGGATDIRFGGTGLFNRVMVSAGGGASSISYTGGSAGGTQGFDGGGSTSYNGKGASQTGSAGYNTGGFGYGGNGSQRYTDYNNGGGAGGGGWYGGGGTYEYGNYYGSGGGGSSYVFTPSSHKPTGYAPSVKYYVSNPVLIDGSSLMPGKEGHTTLGNEGDGFVRISLLNMYGTDARLKYLEFSSGTLNQSFDPSILEYDLVLDKDVTTLTISADTVDHNAFVSWDSNETLTIMPGVTKYDLVVTAQDGSIQTYIVRVHRAASSNTRLDGLYVDGVLVDNFEEDTFNYEVNLAYDAMRNATISWEGARPAQVITGPETVVFENNKPIQIVVGSEDGLSESTYTITPRIENSNLLKQLDIQELTLEFDPHTFIYDIEVPLGVSSLNITALAYDHEATISIRGNGYLKVGMNTVTITVDEPYLDSQVYTLNVLRSESADGSYDAEYDFVYTGDVQYFEAPYTGNYRLEAWGAEGGNRGGSAVGGKGAYTTGIVSLKQGEIIAVYVGGAGTSIQKGYNGGGLSGTAGVYGGGASDVRVGSYSLYERILVAGGGGSVGAASRKGADAGGLVGLSATQSYGSGGQGATQTTAGLRGSFGMGGDGLYQYNGRSGAGGGGWYGGGGATPDRSADDDRGGGGGSSYYLNAESYKPENYSVDAAYYLTETQTIAGNAQLPNKDGGYTVGNVGNGFVRVTALRRASTDNYLKDIQLNGNASLLPEFDLDINSYDIHLDVDQTELIVRGLTMDPMATVSGNGSYNIPSTGKTIDLVVTAEDGSLRTYTLNVTRDASNNAYPQDVVITGLVPSLCDVADEYCELSPEFSVTNSFIDENGIYTMMVPGRIKSLEFTVVKGHHYQTVIGGGLIELEPGSENYVYIEVESEDGQNHVAYTFNIERDMTGNADLEKLSLVDPLRNLEFSPDVTEYYVSVPNEYEHTDDLSFEIETMDPNASYIIEGEGDLSLGNNIYSIQVIANNGLQKRYTVNIYRENNGNTFLNQLILTHNDKALIMSPNFNKTLHDYLITVENEVDEIKILAQPEAESTDISMNPEGIYSLEVGVNNIALQLTAENGNTSIYQITVVRKESSNANIAGLKLNGEGIDGFDSAQTNQSFNIDSQITKPNLEIELESEVASYVISGNYDTFKPGSNVVHVRVTAEDGTVKSYTFDFNKAVSSDASLSAIVSSKFDISDRFDKDIFEYDINIPYSEDPLVLSATPTHHTSKVSGLGNYYLTSGMNEVKIDILAEDGGSSATYTLRINMLKNTNPELQSISLSHGVFEPEFDAKITSYAVNVPNEVDVIDISAIAKVASTKIEGVGSYVLNTGVNDIFIKTRAESGKEMTYALKVTRDVSSNADLSYLVVHEGALHRDFLANVLEYDVKVPYGTKRLTIEASVSDPFATYTILNANDLKAGLNQVIVRVTPQNKVGVKDYILNVFVQGPSSSNIDLTNLKVTPGTLSPDFLPIRQFYRVTVENDVTQINVSAAVGNDNVVTGNGNYNLKVGRNRIVVTTKSSNGVIKDYQIEVTRKPSSEARLSTLSLSGIRGSYTFRTNTFNYAISTENTTLGIKAVPMHENATVTILGNDHFVTNTKTLVIVRVVAEDGITTQDYTLNITKNASKNNNLASLSISGVHFEPVFSPSRTTYKAVVTEEVRQVVISAKAEDTNATLVYNQRENLEVGQNFIDIDVVSESNARRRYTVVIEREGSRNRNLTDILVDGISIDNFNKDVLSYQLDTVEFETESLSINALLEDDRASVSGIGNVNLEVGINHIPIVVTSEHGDLKTYTLVIERKPINSAELASLSVDQYPFDQGFNSDKTSYQIVIDNEFNRLNLDIKLKDENAKYTITGNTDLKEGNNTIMIHVVSSAGDKEKTYVIYAYKQAYGSNYLAYLETDKGTLSPTFYRGQMVYTLDLSYEVDTVTLRGEPVEYSATVSNLGTYDLEYGENHIQIPVKAHNGVVRTYHVFVNRSRSHDNYLNSLVVESNGKALSFSPSFDPLVNEYTLDEDVEPGTEFLNLKVSTNATNVKGHNQQAIKVGENTLEILVTSNSGKTNTYKINLNRVASSNNNLTNITPTSGKLSPNFVYTENTYTVYVDTQTTTLAFEVASEDKNASVTGHTRQIVPVGTSQREIVVTAENGDSKVYDITVIKDETNNINLDSLSVVGYAISPTFNPDTYTYEVTVPNSKTQLRANEVKFETEDPNATVEVTGNLTLQTGSAPNVYEIRVTAVDGFTTETYRLMVYRESGQTADIESIEFNKGTLNKAFNSFVYEYDLEFDSDITSFNKNDISKLILVDSNAKVTYSHDSTIELKENQVVPFTITVTSENNSVVNHYVFNVTYTRSKDNRLSNIVIADAVFKPEFNPEVFEYDVSVHETTRQVIIQGFTRDPKATLVSKLGETALINHTNTVEIKVQAENGATITYKLNIKRDLSHSVDLIDMSLTNAQGATLTPKFDNFLSSYEAVVVREVDRIGLNVTKGHDSQTLTLYDRFNNVLNINDFSLNMGRNLFKLKVSSPYGDEKMIDILIVRDGNSNTYLSQLEITDPSLDFGFDKDTHEYFIEVPYGYESIGIDAIAESETSKVDILYNNQLVPGNNDVVVKVTSENGDIRNYVLHVYVRPLNNNALINITVSVGGNIISQGPDFTPHFNRGITSYTATVSSNHETVTVQGVPEDSTITVSGSAEHVLSHTDNGVEVQLNPGNNKVKLMTLNPSGDVQIYTINLNREMSDSADLNLLYVSNDDVVFPFNEGDFDPSLNFYTLNVGPEVDALTVVANAINSNARVEIIGNENLLNGENLVKVTVTSEDRTKMKVYSIVVYKSLSSDNDINALSITHDGGAVHEFNMDIPVFEYHVDKDVDSVVIAGKTSDPLAEILGLGRHALNYGENQLEVKVIAQNKQEKIYTVHVYREFDNDLSELKVNQGELSPVFNPEVHEYTVWVPLEIERIRIEAIANNAPIAQVSGDGWIELKVGSNEAVIRVSSDGINYQDTLVTIIRSASINNNLEVLDIEQGVLSPSFESETVLYETYIRDVHNTLNLTVIPEDETASYTVTGHDYITITGDQVTVKNVVEDTLTLNVNVTAENGDTKVYTLNIYRQPSALFSNLLKSLEVTPIKSMSPSFNPNTNAYVANVDEAVKEITINAIKQAADAEIISGNGTFKVNPGRNVYEIVVRSKDGIDNVYKIIINQAVSSDATLSELSFEEGYLTPVFSRLRKTYRMNVSANTNFLTPTIVPYANGTTWRITGAGFTEDLVMGENTVTIETTAANGVEKDTYTIIVNKTNQTSVYLSEITSNVGTFKENFNKYEEGPYTLEIDDNVNSLMLSAKAEEPASVSSIDGVGIIDMTNLNNKQVTITVNGKAGNSMTYVVNIVKKLSSSVKLSYLAVNPGTLSPTFDSEISQYNVTVGSDVDRIEILGSANGNVIIEGLGVKELKPGTNTFNVVVTSDLGSVGVYTLRVEREIAHTARIMNLRFKEALIENPSFYPDDTQYQLYVSYETTSLTIDEIVFEDPDNVSYELIQSNFGVGSNVVDLVVTNHVSNEVMTYRFDVTRYIQSSNYLINLSTDQGNLSPFPFDREHNNYDIDVPYTVTSITLNGSTEDGNASVSGIGIHENLKVGVNELKVVVTSTTGVPRTYIVRVNRLEDSRNDLTSLSVLGGTLSPVFPSGQFNEYTVNVDGDTDVITFVGETHETATILGLGDFKVTQEKEIHEIVVTAQDGQTQTYTFTIIKQLSSDAFVTNIVPSTSVMTPSFTQDVHQYNMVVDDDVKSISFNVTTSNPFAKVSGHETKQLNYGDNEFVITVQSENKQNTTTYTIVVKRLKDVHGLSLDPTNIVMNVGDFQQIDLSHTPEDATNLDVIWVSDNEDSVMVDENGNITAVGMGSAQITVMSSKNPNIKASAVVEVMNLSIASEQLDIVRAGLKESEIKDYVVGAQPLTSIRDFIEMFENETSTLHVYDKDGKRIDDLESFVGTGMTLKLTVNNTVYDEMVILVRGDSNGDGYANIVDVVKLQNITLGVADENEIDTIVFDFNEDEFINVVDLVKLKNYTIGLETNLN